VSSRDAAGPAAGIILAAGCSKRFGANKLLARLNGRPVIAWVVRAALGSRLARIVLVLGHERRRVLEALGGLPPDERVATVFNPRYAEGQSTSLRAGLERVAADCSAAMFLLGDQPRIRAEVIDRLLERWRGSGAKIAVPVHAGKRGNPVVFDRAYFPAIFGIEGDKGARDLIAANPQQVLEVAFDDPGLFLDVDTPADLAAAAALGDPENPG
jgi:molybdenum cofactor cytidylyltransferase